MLLALILKLHRLQAAPTLLLDSRVAPHLVVRVVGKHAAKRSRWCRCRRGRRCWRRCRCLCHHGTSSLAALAALLLLGALRRRRRGALRRGLPALLIRSACALTLTAAAVTASIIVPIPAAIAPVVVAISPVVVTIAPVVVTVTPVVVTVAPIVT